MAAQREIHAAVASDPLFRRARRIAGYVGSHGEVDAMPLLELAARHGRQCYLPVLHPFLRGRLWFCRWRPGDRMVRNRYGIPEPAARKGRLVSPRWLDLVLMPLVGFDDRCRRIGMGGGYYDRTFAFARSATCRKRPSLIGLAFAVQRVDAIAQQPWDVSLDVVITEAQRHRAR